MELRFYFDVVCPYAYLASTEVEHLAARFGATVRWCPVLLGGIYRALDAPQQPAASRSEARRHQDTLDLHRQARRLGLTFAPNPRHPIRTVDAMRLVIGAPEARRGAIAHRLFAAYHREHLDVSDRTVLARLAAEVGVEAHTMDDPAVKQALFDATAEATDRGHFGVPTFEVGEEMFWGLDRLHFVASALGGTAAPEPPPSATPGRVVAFFHDFASPFSYLAATQIRRIASRHQARLSWSPILLGALFRDIGTADVPLFTMSAARRAYIRKDLEDWARWWEVPFRFPSQFPIRSVQALRAAIVAPEATDAIYRAAWVEDRPIGEPSVLHAVLASEGLDADAILAKTQDAAIKDHLRRNTQDAQDRGLCGVPSMLLDGHTFWGQDRLHHLDEALGGQAPEH